MNAKQAIIEMSRASSYLEIDHVAGNLGITHGYARRMLYELYKVGQLTRRRVDGRLRYVEPGPYCPHCGQVIR